MSHAGGAWAAVLDLLGADLDAVEQQLADPAAAVSAADLRPLVQPWVPPSVPGPLPASLRARAELTLARQRRVSEQLIGALSATGRQQALTASLGRTFAAPSAPVYLDVTA